MEKKIPILFALGVLLMSCNHSNSSPSINDNSVHKVEQEQIDYSAIEPDKLLKHIQAHYDLEQYQLSKEKLNYLLQTYSDSLNGVSLLELKVKIDNSLREEQLVREAMAQAEIKKRLPYSINQMRIVEERGEIYYYDKSSPEFDTRECFYAYVVKGIYGVELFFKLRYVGTSWIDMKQCVINVDQLDYTLKEDVLKSETKGKKAYKHELINVKITTDEQMEMLEAIANGNEVLTLLIGEKTYRKRIITKEQRVAIRNVLDTFIFLSDKEEENFKKNITNVNN